MQIGNEEIKENYAEKISSIGNCLLFLMRIKEKKNKNKTQRNGIDSLGKM